MSDTNTVKGNEKELPLTKIFWGGGADGKEPKSVQITLTENYGGQNLGILTRIFNVARQDFSNAGLNLNQVNAVVLNGDIRKGMWGIEFHIPASVSLPKGYKKEQPNLILSGGL